jgi:hypothetical protein
MVGGPENRGIDGEKMNRMYLSLQHLLLYADEGGEDMLNSIVTGAGSLVHHY